MRKNSWRGLKRKRLFRFCYSIYLLLVSLSFLILLDPAFGRFLWLQHRKEMVRKEVAEKIANGIEKDKLIFLEFSSEEARTKLRWRSEREFEFNRELYDVVDSAIKGDKVLFWCWPDTKETGLEREIAEIASRALKNKSKALINQESSSLSFQCWLFFSYSNLELFRPYFLSSLHESPFKFCLFFFPQPPTPPPRSLM
ncbi:MAG: hypothetical protein N3B16_08070 [Candidatus Aminicenantes bacterium]|nr:hypothetical protein [Candidatus Aminicenantes bacterium]